MNRVTQGDCMDYLPKYPDNYFKIAIVDPPYGINAEHGTNRASRKQFKEAEIGWDSTIPEEDYFKELFRVSEYQIIWGGNYFLDFLPSSKSFIIWDKLNPDRNFGDCEFAWCSPNFNLVPRIFKPKRVQELNKLDGGKIHPTQKPVSLYHWTMEKFIPKEWGIVRILDTHIGSGSIRLAADILGHELVGFERDLNHFNEQEARYVKFKQEYGLMLCIFNENKPKITLDD